MGMTKFQALLGIQILSLLVCFLEFYRVKEYHIWGNLDGTLQPLELGWVGGFHMPIIIPPTMACLPICNHMTWLDPHQVQCRCVESMSHRCDTHALSMVSILFCMWFPVILLLLVDSFVSYFQLFHSLLECYPPPSPFTFWLSILLILLVFYTRSSSNQKSQCVLGLLSC